MSDTIRSRLSKIFEDGRELLKVPVIMGPHGDKGVERRGSELGLSRVSAYRRKLIARTLDAASDRILDMAVEHDYFPGELSLHSIARLEPEDRWGLLERMFKDRLKECQVRAEADRIRRGQSKEISCNSNNPEVRADWVVGELGRLEKILKQTAEHEMWDTVALREIAEAQPLGAHAWPIIEQIDEALTHYMTIVHKASEQYVTLQACRDTVRCQRNEGL